MPFIAPLIPAIAGAVGAATSGGGGDDGGSNRPTWGQAQAAAAQKANAFQYGGQMGGAQAAQDRYQGLGAQWGHQAAPATDYSGSERYQGLGDQARGDQQSAMGSMRDAMGLARGAAMGNAPSQAAIMMKQGNDQAIANQMSMAAGARGPAAMAMAQQNAMGNASNMSTQNMNNTGALRAQEMAQARAAYGGMASGYGQMATGMRGQDLQYMGQNANQAQYLSDLEMRQRGLGLQGQLGWEGMARGVAQDQMGAQMGLQGFDQKQWQTQSAMDEASRRAAEDTAMKGIQAGASIVSGAIAGGGK